MLVVVVININNKILFNMHYFNAGLEHNFKSMG